MKVHDNSSYGRAGLPDGIKPCSRKISFLVTEDEFKIIRKAAGTSPLSSWMRRLAVKSASRKAK